MIYFYTNFGKDKLLSTYFKSVKTLELPDEVWMRTPQELNKLKNYFYQALQKDKSFRDYFYRLFKMENIVRIKMLITYMLDVIRKEKSMYAVVGLDRTTQEITTFHVRNIKKMRKWDPSLGFEPWNVAGGKEMILIKSINWLDEPSYEGEVTLIDSNQRELICFIYQLPPEDIDVSDIYAIANTDILKSDVNRYCLKHIEHFKHYVVGKLLDKASGRIQCFDYIFETGGYLPGDVQEGDWVEFGVGRFDL